MHDGDELRSEMGLNIMCDVFDGGGDGVMSGEWGVYDNSKVFDLEVSLVQGFKWATVIEVMVE